jgi:hypothetical protein
MYQVNMPPPLNNNNRGSVPPDQRILVNIPQRAKSVSKDTTTCDNNNSLHNSSIFSPSRFFSLSRKFTKLRFNQNTTSTTTIPTTDTEPQKPVSVKKPARERALSPSKIFRNLRPRSPFSRIRSSSSKSSTCVEATTTTTTTTNAPTTPLISTPNSTLMTMSCYSSIEPNTDRSLSYTQQTAENKLANDKLRASLSCEFIDNSSALSATTAMITSALTELKERPLDFDSNEKQTKSQRIKKLNLNSFNTEQLIDSTTTTTTATTNGITQTVSTNEIVKTVKFKEPLEVENKNHCEIETSNFAKPRNKAEEQLINALDETLLSVDLRSSPSLSNSTNDEECLRSDNKRFNQIKTSFSNNNVDKPPKPPSIYSFNTSPTTTTTTTTVASSTRSKFAQNKSRTIDFPDLLQSAMDSANQTSTSASKTSTSTSYLATNTLPQTVKPIHSILRRSETPPVLKAAVVVRQTSIESTESSRDRERETSLEKKLRISSSTSRPLMFNN